MEHLSVHLLGNILSRLGAARDVVIASTTCRKWRDAFCCHLHTLSFNSNDWPRYHDLTTSQFEILITQTIFQTTGLQDLSLLMVGVGEFSAPMVSSWLMHTRETLRTLFYDLRTTSNVNILEIYGRQKLEKLDLAHNSITEVKPNYQRFSCLKSLCLRYVSISASDLSLLLTACPKLEFLHLVNPKMPTSSDKQVKIELRSPTLECIYVEQSRLGKVILEADGLKRLNLNLCNFERFELLGKGTLKQCEIHDVGCMDFDIGETLENLEVVDISNFTTIWPKFYKMISRSSKLRRLRLWNVPIDHKDEIVDLETFPVCFPQLSHLFLCCGYLRDGVFHYGSPGSSHLDNVIEMELGWIVINKLFSDWVEGLVERCPNLRKLVIHGVISEIETQEEYQMLANFMSSIVRLMRKYMQVEIQFVFS